MIAELKILSMPSDEPESPSAIAGSPGLLKDPQELPDQQTLLWARVREGDRAAFELIYRTLVGSLFALCLRMTANRASAEDCVQATFIAAWEKRHSFRGDSQLKTWLHRIAVNKVLGKGRSEGRRREVLDSYAAQSQSAMTESLDRGGDRGLDLDLEKAISAVPERSRQVFVLHAIHGYKHNEVGALLGIASGTSKAHYHRSRQILRAALMSQSAGVQQ